MSLSSLACDLRFALRLMRQRPVFYVLLLLVIAGGVGMTTATFSVVQAFVVRPLPYPQSEDLIAIWRSPEPGERSRVSQAQYLQWKARATTLTHVAAAINDGFPIVTPDGSVERRHGSRVSGDFFSMFGLEPRLGRLLTPDDDRESSPAVVVLSEALWRSHFAADPAIVGRSLSIENRPHVVVGVAAEGFGFSTPGCTASYLWVPLGQYGGYPWLRASSRVYTSQVVARRRPGVSLGAIEAELSELARPAGTDPSTTAERPHILAMDLQRAVLGALRPALLASFAAIALTFLMVCSTVASLLMMRAHSRRGEFALRAALGASRAGLVRQSLIETLLVFVVSLPASSGVAYVAFLLIADGSFEGYPVFRRVDAVIDLHALAFCATFSLISGAVAGLLPALHVWRGGTRGELAEAGARASAPKWLARSRGVLVVIQVAIAFTLLTGGGLSWASLDRLLAKPPGFEPRGLVSARIWNIEHYPEPAARYALYERVIADLRHMPGVTAVAGNQTMPLAGYDGEAAFELAGASSASFEELPSAPRNVVTPGYFETMQIPSLLGRVLLDTDNAESEPVVLINQAMSDRYFSNQDPIGRYLHHPDHDGGRLRRIVGVVGNTLRRGLAAPPVPETYVPYGQAPMGGLALVLRSDDPKQTLDALPARLAAIDPRIQTLGWSVADDVRFTVRDFEKISQTLYAVAAVTLSIAILNLHALIAYLTVQRTRELGIRVALGASPESLLWLIVRVSLKWLATGALLGMVLGLVLGQKLMAEFPDVQAFDPVVYAGVSAIILVTGLVAALLAALRALRVPPAAALRFE